MEILKVDNDFLIDSFGLAHAIRFEEEVMRYAPRLIAKNTPTKWQYYSVENGAVLLAFEGTTVTVANDFGYSYELDAFDASIVVNLFALDRAARDCYLLHLDNEKIVYNFDLLREFSITRDAADKVYDLVD